jgi:hypothetical protein
LAFSSCAMRVSSLHVNSSHARSYSYGSSSTTDCTTVGGVG